VAKQPVPVVFVLGVLLIPLSGCGSVSTARPEVPADVQQLVAGVAQTAAADPRTAPGAHPVAVERADWVDPGRNRIVPVKIYYPSDSPTPSPVIIFSHGLGGSRELYSYLGEHWASHGYVCIHPQHSRSDTSVWQDQANPRAALRAAASPWNAVARARDITFVLDKLTELDATPDFALHGRVDLTRIGVGGHSFGANTALVTAGQVFVLREQELSYADSRVKAALPLSAPATRANPDVAYAHVALPCLHMTGTLDNSPIGDTSAAQRRIPFDHIPHAPQYLITFVGGDHYIFSGRQQAARPTDAAYQTLIRAASLAYWDAFLRDDADARRWLNDGGLRDLLGGAATLETK
jgi:dienelactone hydrolase